MKKRNVVSITVLYNFDEQVVKNIETYAKYVDEVVLVDNSDSHENYEKFEKELQKYTYIYMDGNKGIAKALNKGILYAKEKKYKWCLTFDQDSKVESNLVDIYFDYINKLQDDNIIIYSPYYEFERNKQKKFTGVKQVKYVMQSANLLNIDAFIKNGKFKEDFFIDMVDYEFCLRAKKNGYKIVSCGEAKLVHNPAITRESKLFKIKYGYCSKERIYYQARNILWTYREYNELSLLFILVYKYIKIICFFDNKKEYLRYFKKGIKDCLNNKSGVIDNE